MTGHNSKKRKGDVSIETIKGNKITWNFDWIEKFESTWGIFEKIRYANSIDSRELIRLINKENTISSPFSVRTSHRDLYLLEHINDEKIFNLIGLRLKERQGSLIKQLTKVLPGNPTTYFRDYLAYCEECMSHGYHSLFHQFNLSNTCPFHLTRLIHQCPKCHRKIPYLLSDEYPFQCCCEFSFITGVSTTNFKIWSNFNTPELIHEVYDNWLLLNNGNKKTSNILFELDLYRQEGRNFLGDLLTIFTSIKHNGDFSVINIGKLRRRSTNLLITEDSVLKEKIYRASINTYKATIRHLKKTVLLKHKTCIARCKKMAPDDKACPYAITFLHWRMYIEGLNNIWEVENMNRRKASNKTAFLLKQDKEYIDKIYQKLIENSSIFNSEAQLISILNRIFYILIINHFNNWLKTYMLYQPQRVLFHRVPFNNEELPFFIIESKFNKQSGKSILFWTFREAEKHIISNIKCPFDTVKLRRKRVVNF